MLNARYLENTISTHPVLIDAMWGVEGDNEVKRTVPALRSVARIITNRDSVSGSRSQAYVFPLPDGTLIRLDINDDNTYDYKSATTIPDTHPAAKAYAQNLGHSVEFTLAEEGDIGPRANPADVKKLKERLEADICRYQQEQANEHRLKL
ncbi:MAG: hypothetical protein WC612_07435 [Bdellovibrionales bacterium]|jgi:hypothetical protein